MGLETANLINELNPANPAGGDARSTADDHLRLIKSTLKTTFPNITGAVTASHASINKVGTTATVGDDSTYPASTAFVQAALATQSMNGAMTMRVSSTLATNAAVGEHIILTNGSASTVLLPATPLAGSRVWASSANGVAGNVLQRNGALIDGVASDFTIIATRGTAKLRYVSAPVGWVVESDRTNQAWAGITGKPTTVAGYGITDAGFRYDTSGVQSVYGDSGVNQFVTCSNPTSTFFTLAANPVNGQRTRVLFMNSRLDNKVWPGGKTLKISTLDVGPGEWVNLNKFANVIHEFVYVAAIGCWVY